MSLHILIPAATADELQERVSPTVTRSEAARAALARYFAVVASGRASLKGRFDAAELSLLADICAGTLFEPYCPPAFGGQASRSQLAQEAADAESAYFDKWQVSRPRLLAKLDNLSVAEDLALVDAIERYWRGKVGVDPAAMLD